MVGLGMGISLIPALYVRAEMIDDPAVVVREIAIKDAARWIALVWRASSPRSDDFLGLAKHLSKRAHALLAGLELEANKPGSKRTARPLDSKHRRAQRAPAKLKNINDRPRHLLWRAQSVALRCRVVY